MQRPRIKRVHNPERLSRNRIRIGTHQYGVGAEIEDDPAGATWRLLQLMDGSRDIPTITRALQQALPGLDGLRIRAAIDRLIQAGFVEDAATAPHTLTPEELARYDRNLHYFAWVDIQPRPSAFVHQERLKHARVTVLGLGGAGSAAAMSLAAAGVGQLHCVDADIIEESNLNRQLLYSEADLGKPKVDVAVARLRAQNSHICITGERLNVRSTADILSLMEERDLLLLCADSPHHLIQRWVNDAAIRTGVPWLIAAYNGPTLVVGIFVPGTTPCYGCIEESEIESQRERDGGREPLLNALPPNAVIAPTASLAGHWAALEAIYFLTDLQPQTVGRVLHQNLMIYDHSYYITAPMRPDCPACGVGRSG